MKQLECMINQCNGYCSELRSISSFPCLKNLLTFYHLFLVSFLISDINIKLIRLKYGLYEIKNQLNVDESG